MLGLALNTGRKCKAQKRKLYRGVIGDVLVRQGVSKSVHFPNFSALSIMSHIFFQLSCKSKTVSRRIYGGLEVNGSGLLLAPNAVTFR